MTVTTSTHRKKVQKLRTNHRVSRRIKKGFTFYCAIVVALTIVFAMPITAFAAGDDPLTVVNNLSDFIFGLIRAIGLILLGFGIVQVGLSLKSHDPSQRANGFLTVAGGIVITFAKEILSLITGG
ncbi:MAG: glutamyl-tRNA amidotransferase [Clostridia bacterium]|nr:glutamyl-tRNA amidotransferase [Clostridia bacterium]